MKAKEIDISQKEIYVGISSENATRTDSLYIDDLKKVKGSISTAPTFIPKKFYDMIQLYDDGVDKKLYLYINNSWVSVTLT